MTALWSQGVGWVRIGIRTVPAEFRQRPQEDEDRGEGEGRPALEDRPDAVVAQLDRARSLPILHQTPRPPETEEGHRHQEREDRGHDVDEARIVPLVVGPVELHRCESAPAHDERGQHLERLLPPHHGDDQPGRQDEREGGQNPADHGVEVRDGEPGDPVQDPDRVAHAAPRHRRRVGEQAQHRRLEVREPESDEERARDRHRCASAPAALEEGPEAECDEDDLEAPVRGDARDRLLHHLELPGLDRDVVEVDRGDDDPGDPEEAEDEAVDPGGGNHRGRHPEHGSREHDGHQEAAERRDPHALAQHQQHEEQRGDRERGDEGRQGPPAERVVVLVPDHGVLRPTAARTSQSLPSET